MFKDKFEERNRSNVLEGVFSRTSAQQKPSETRKTAAPVHWSHCAGV